MKCGRGLWVGKNIEYGICRSAAKEFLNGFNSGKTAVECVLMLQEHIQSISRLFIFEKVDLMLRL